KDRRKSVLIKVADTGIGIAEDDQTKIFEEFYRAQNAKALDRDGTGMGLSIVSQVVKIHKAKIWFESKIKEGTTFWVSIPKKT
ncbi:MAG: HAMP domain-containing histidine kinase, partial [Bacteroidales bacterium]|nr:HAMP domain-containing histidine kinase [Bacteroidales bacterium]